MRSCHLTNFVRGNRGVTCHVLFNLDLILPEESQNGPTHPVPPPDRPFLPQLKGPGAMGEKAFLFTFTQFSLIETNSPIILYVVRTKNFVLRHSKISTNRTLSLCLYSLYWSNLHLSCSHFSPTHSPTFLP